MALGNDVRVATQAEFELGAGRMYRSLLGVFWGTGVGGGLILDGKPWLGRGGAGEIGHVVVEMEGALCTCGRRGCMEAYAGRAAMEAHAEYLHREKGRSTDLFKLMRERGRTRVTSGVWARALADNDKLAVHMLDRAVTALGAGVASVVNVLDVEAVLIGGGLGVRLGHPYAERIAAAMTPHLFKDYDPPPVHVAALGDLGGAIGPPCWCAKGRRTVPETAPPTPAPRPTTPSAGVAPARSPPGRGGALYVGGMLSFWPSIVLLSIVQGVLVALPGALRDPRLARLRSGRWA